MQWQLHGHQVRFPPSFSPLTLFISLFSSSSSLYFPPSLLFPSLSLPPSLHPPPPTPSLSLSPYVYFNMEIIASESCFVSSGFKQFHININDSVQERQNQLVIYFFSSRIYVGVKLLLFTCINEQMHHICFVPLMYEWVIFQL